MSPEFSNLAPPPLLGTDSRPSVGVQQDLFGCHGDGDLIIHLQDSSRKGGRDRGRLEKARAPKSETKEISGLDMRTEVCQLAQGRKRNIFTSLQALRMDRITDWNPHHFQCTQQAYSQEFNASLQVRQAAEHYFSCIIYPFEHKWGINGGSKKLQVSAKAIG